MRISVIIPAYNAAKYLAQTLDSVISQTYPDWELIIVNDGSRDNTGEIAEAYAAGDPRIRVIRQENAGVSQARNHGFSQSSPDTSFVIFLDADDLWKPEALTFLLSALERSPESTGAYASACHIDGNGQPCSPSSLGSLTLEQWVSHRQAIVKNRIVSLLPDELTSFPSFALRQHVPTPGALLLRRTALERLGKPQDLFRRGKDNTFYGCEDYDLYLNLIRFGGFIFENRTLLKYRVHDASMSTNMRKMHRAERHVRKAHYEHPTNTLEQKRLVALGYRLKEWECYQQRIKEAYTAVFRGEIMYSGRAFFYGQANLLRSLSGP